MPNSWATDNVIKLRDPFLFSLRITRRTTRKGHMEHPFASAGLPEIFFINNIDRVSSRDRYLRKWKRRIDAGIEKCPLNGNYCFIWGWLLRRFPIHYPCMIHALSMHHLCLCTEGWRHYPCFNHALAPKDGGISTEGWGHWHRRMRALTPKDEGINTEGWGHHPCLRHALAGNKSNYILTPF